MRQTLIITLVLATALSPWASAGEIEQIRQVSYELIVIELEKSDALMLGISLPEPSALFEAGARAITRLVHSPGLVRLLQAGAGLVEFSASREQNQKISLDQPRITIALGETGSLSLATEEWHRNPDQHTFSSHQYGLKLLLTPVQTDSDGGRILTDVQLSTTAPRGLLTSVWTNCGELEPLGVLTYQQKAEETRPFYSARKIQTRFFAVYLRAEARSNLPQDIPVQIGSLDGLTALLWPRETSMQPSSLKMTAPVYPFSVPEVELQCWVSKSVKLGITTTGRPFDFCLELGLALNKEEFLLQSRLRGGNFPTRLALGVTDRVQINGNLAFSAGVYPLIVDLHQRKLERAILWWAQLETYRGKIYSSLKWETEIEHSRLEGSLGYSWTPQDMVFLNCRTDFEDHHSVGVGYRREF